MSFLPKNYELPTAETGYLRLTEGSHKFRVMSDALLGRIVWIDAKYTEDGKSKPKRYKMDEKMIQNKEWHFWAFVVWNYKTERFQILDITQRTIQREITDLWNTKEWGDPHSYDISIKRTGTSMDDTVYTVQGIPHAPLPEEIKEAYDKLNFNLDALFENKDPFENVEGKEESKATRKESEVNPEDDPDTVIKPEDLPF